MKKKIIIICLLLGLTSTGYSQLTFSVSPGLSLNGASFGYKINKIVPFIGIQYFGTSVNFTYTDEYFNFDSNAFEKYENVTTQKLNLFIPTIGVKYFFFETEKLKASALISFTKPIVSGELTFDGEIEESVEKAIDGLSVWGGELSFGTEYFFDEHFSIGGEFGFRYLHLSAEITDPTILYNPNTGDPYASEYKMTTKVNARPTFSRISLNFYF